MLARERPDDKFQVTFVEIMVIWDADLAVSVVQKLLFGMLGTSRLASWAHGPIQAAWGPKKRYVVVQAWVLYRFGLDFGKSFFLHTVDNIVLHACSRTLFYMISGFESGSNRQPLVK